MSICYYKVKVNTPWRQLWSQACSTIGRAALRVSGRATAPWRSDVKVFRPNSLPIRTAHCAATSTLCFSRSSCEVLQPAIPFPPISGRSVNCIASWASNRRTSVVDKWKRMYKTTCRCLFNGNSLTICYEEHLSWGGFRAKTRTQYCL